MEQSRRQFFKYLGLSSVAAAAAPLSPLEALANPLSVSTLAKAPPTLLRLQFIEQALVSTYGILDLTNSMLSAGGLIDGPAHTAFSLAGFNNFMLSEAGTPEARSILLRLLRPDSANGVVGETETLFRRLAHERERSADDGDIDDFRASLMNKLTRVVDRLDENQRLAPLISERNSTNNPLTQRVAAWCDKLFSGRSNDLATDPLFEALSTLHRMEVCRDIPFCPDRQRRLLRTIEDEGYPSPREEIYGPKNAAKLRQCELLAGAIDNALVSSKTFIHPPHLIAAAGNLASQCSGYATYTWEKFYRERFKDYARTAILENAESSNAAIENLTRS